MHTTTQNLLAALWDGVLDAQAVLNQMTDRHYAQGPELDVKRELLVANCRQRLKRRALFNVAHLLALAWAAWATLNWLNEDLNERAENGLIGLLFLPYVLMVFLEFCWTLWTNKRKLQIAASTDEFLTDQVPPAIGHNVVIYSGFSPFSAFGVPLESWSLLVDTTKTLPSHTEAEAFSSADLISSLSGRLQGLLVGARVQDVLFVRGSMLPEFPDLLKSRISMPITSMDQESISLYVEKNEPFARLYRSCMQRIGASGAIFTAFVRTHKRQSQLFIECHQYLLPDLRRDFRKLDDQIQFRPVHFFVSSIVGSLLAGPIMAIVAAFAILSSIFRAAARFTHALLDHPLDKQKCWGGRFDYGHRQTFRSKCSADEYDTFFQTQDKEALRKATNIAIVNELAAFLKSKGIDVGDLESSKQQIINSGVFVAGGTFSSAAFASGSKAQATTNVVGGPA